MNAANLGMIETLLVTHTLQHKLLAPGRKVGKLKMFQKRAIRNQVYATLLLV